MSQKKRFFLSLLVLLSFQTLLCGDENPAFVPKKRIDKNVFGQDNRVPLAVDSYPGRATVKVMSDGGHCSGSIVGPDLVLTNAHCIFDSNGNQENNIFVYPAQSDNSAKYYKSSWSRVWYGTNKPDSNRSADWAILRMNARLGDGFGYFGTRTPSSQEFNSSLRGRINVAGYSGDLGGQEIYVHSGCNITKDWGSILYHDCDTTRGSSGGPAYIMENGSAYIVGLNAAEMRNGGETSLQGVPYSDSTANIAVKVNNFGSKINELRASKEGVPANTMIYLCNTSNRGTIYSAIAFYQDGWKSKGWYALENRECKEISFGLPYTGAIFVYAEINGGQVSWGGGKYSFCVDKTNAFEAPKADGSCPNGNYKKVNFSAEWNIGKDKFNEWTFRN